MEPTPQRPDARPEDLFVVANTETVHHDQSGSSKKRPPRGISQLQLTSMMDVCFQLLIFFIVTANFAIGEGILAANLPTGQGAKSDKNKPPEQPMNILLRSLGGSDVSIQIEGMTTPPANFNELYALMATLQHNKQNPSGVYEPDNPVIIKPDATVPWGHVVNAFNAAVRARYENVNFATPNKK